MKMQQSIYLDHILEVEGYVSPEEWAKIDAQLHNKFFKISSLDLSRVSNVSIPKSAFTDNAQLKEVTLPEGLVTIEKNAFENCIALKRVTFSNYIKKIDDNAFLNCNLQQFTAPKTLEYLGNCAFKNNYKLSDTKLNSDINFVGKDVFLCEKDKAKAVHIKQIDPMLYDSWEK